MAPMPLATLAAAFASAPDLPPPPPPPSDNDLFEKLQWQMPRSVPTSTGASALQRMLLGQHCEEVVSTSVCPDQFFAFLSVEPSVVLFPDRRTGLQYSPGFRWVATFPECASYLPTQHGPERNGFSVLASTGTNTRGHLEAGAVLLRFENTTSADHGWRSLAGKQQCTVGEIWGDMGRYGEIWGDMGKQQCTVREGRAARREKEGCEHTPSCARLCSTCRALQPLRARLRLSPRARSCAPLRTSAHLCAPLRITSAHHLSLSTLTLTPDATSTAHVHAHVHVHVHAPLPARSLLSAVCRRPLTRSQTPGPDHTHWQSRTDRPTEID